MLLAIANCARRAETVIVIPEIPTEAEIRIATGEVRKIKLIAGALPWQGDPVVPLLLQDMTDLKLIQHRLHILAVTDELTVAFNRRHAFNIGHTLFKEGVTASSKVALAVFAVDHFKRCKRHLRPLSRRCGFQSADAVHPDAHRGRSSQ
ncbi:GGDEF domain-containing protein [Rhizobium leguminosarum]|uniref:GGDEF domain-containing protein n=1 Tax=Rhizobium leguminosarum TaxID=384 RepID=UPI0003A9826A|nr:GGDEF domain-containing protein [Rhizobium leguminosarum]